MKHCFGKLVTTWVAVGMILAGLREARAQVSPAGGQKPPDDTLKINVGVTLFADYTYTEKPKVRDADGNSVKVNSFNIGRAYLNVSGNISHLFAFRVTPDVTRASGANGLPTGSYSLRLKLAYGQFNLDDWTTKGTYLRFGIQDTPYVPFAEGIYRYRFQGTIFVDREGFLTSADAGLSGRFNFPGNYGDVYLGVYNGEGFGNSEVNDRKAFQIRGTLRPAPTAAVWKGLRLTGFYDSDHYVQDAKRERFLANATFEHPYFNAGFDYLEARDQTQITRPEVPRNGWSAWVTPRSPIGLEALLRYDLLNTNTDARPKPKKKRAIAGLAYWPPLSGGKSVAFLLDFEDVEFESMTPLPPRERRYALHTLFSF